MAYLVKVRGKYWELRESYRDEHGKPRSRLLRYIGKRSDNPHARMQQMLATAERKAEAIDAMQIAEFGETGEERKARVQEEAKFTAEKFLQNSNEPVVVDKPLDDLSPVVSQSPPEASSCSELPSSSYTSDPSVDPADAQSQE